MWHSATNGSSAAFFEGAAEGRPHCLFAPGTAEDVLSRCADAVGSVETFRTTVFTLTIRSLASLVTVGRKGRREFLPAALVKAVAGLVSARPSAGRTDLGWSGVGNSRFSVRMEGAAEGDKPPFELRHGRVRLARFFWGDVFPPAHRPYAALATLYRRFNVRGGPCLAAGLLYEAFAE